jgi:hypothetical protein
MKVRLPSSYRGEMHRVPLFVPEAETHFCVYVFKDGPRKWEKCQAPFPAKAKTALYCEEHRALAAEESSRKNAEKAKKRRAAMKKTGLL